MIPKLYNLFIENKDDSDVLFDILRYNIIIYDSERIVINNITDIPTDLLNSGKDIYIKITDDRIRHVLKTNTIIPEIITHYFKESLIVSTEYPLIGNLEHDILAIKTILETNFVTIGDKCVLIQLLLSNHHYTKLDIDEIHEIKHLILVFNDIQLDFTDYHLELNPLVFYTNSQGEKVRVDKEYFKVCYIQSDKQFKIFVNAHGKLIPVSNTNYYDIPKDITITTMGEYDTFTSIILHIQRLFDIVFSQNNSATKTLKLKQLQSQYGVNKTETEQYKIKTRNTQIQNIQLQYNSVCLHRPGIVFKGLDDTFKFIFIEDIDIKYGDSNDIPHLITKLKEVLDIDIMNNNHKKIEIILPSCRLDDNSYNSKELTRQTSKITNTNSSLEPRGVRRQLLENMTDLMMNFQGIESITDTIKVNPNDTIEKLISQLIEKFQIRIPDVQFFYNKKNLFNHKDTLIKNVINLSKRVNISVK